MHQNRPMLIGITGGIGSGKSTVCKVFQTLGVPVFDADTRAKALINESPQIRQSIQKLLGRESYHNGLYNREYVAKIVFSDAQKLTELNNIIHPAVASDFQTWAMEQSTAYVIKEAALLFESGSSDELDAIIVVTAPENLRMERVVHRDAHRSKEDVEKIITIQWSEDRKVELSQFKIRNDESELVIPQVLKIHSQLNSQVTG